MCASGRQHASGSVYPDTLFDFVQHVLQTSVQGDEMSVGQDRAEGVSTQYRLHDPAQHTLRQQL